MYSKNTRISITIQGDGSEIFDYSLPQPHNYIRTSLDRYTIEYYLHGDFFCTNKAGAYLNDILARFTLTMNVIEAVGKISREHHHKPLKLYDNNQFNGLRSIEKFKYKETVNVDKDNVFWAIKLYTEDLIKKSSGMVAYSLLESFAFSHFLDRAKDKSTLKAKCRSIWNWYDERDWTIPKRYERTLQEYLKDTKMTRTENMHKINADKVDRNYKKVVNLLTGLFNDEYKKKNGKWHIGKIAIAVNMTEKTVSKYIKEFEKRQIWDKLFKIILCYTTVV